MSWNNRNKRRGVEPNVPNSDNEEQDFGAEQVRAALGAVAASGSAIFWVYLDENARWCLRREGASGKMIFDTRRMCLDQLVVEITRHSSYRLFLQGSDGRIREESFNELPVV
jgi:hypothetical protein